MKKPIFTGAGCAIVTPFTGKDLEKINYSLFETLIEEQINNGTDAIIVCGTTGEKSTLADTENNELIRAAVSAASKRVPVIAGTGSNDTKKAVKLSNEAETLGVDGLLMVTPCYNKCSQQGLIDSFTYIAKRVSSPIILYNVPSRTGVNIKPETYAALSELPLINGIKEANGDIAAFTKTVALCGDSLNYYSGNDDQITSFMSLGAVGVISVLSNIVPAIAHKIVENALKGDFKASARLQTEYSDLCSALFCDVNPIPVKAALKLMGKDIGGCRLPLTELNENNMHTLKCALKNHGII